jgi:hypothetical protein
MTFSGNSAFRGVMWSPEAYFAPTLAGKRCIFEVALIDLCFRI